MTDRTIDRDLLASAMSWLLAGIALIVLDLRLDQFDFLFDPAGGVVVAIGISRVVRATPATSIALPLHALAWLHVALLTGVEVGVLTGELAVGGVGLTDSTEASLLWQVVATAETVVNALGVIALAQHLRRCLVGVASDRWRQVTISWVASLVALPLLLLTGALELVFLGLAIVAIAGVLLLVSLFATRRAAEDDDLDRDFEQR